MSPRTPVENPAGPPAHRPLILSEADPQDLARILALQSDPGVEVIDRRAMLLDQVAQMRPAVTAAELAEPGRWVFYPWRRTLVWVLSPTIYRNLRLDRNRNKITRAEQDGYAGLSIGVIGLSVGHAIAHTLALEGLCGQLRLADFDVLELSNLNRIPATVMDVGINKAVVAARRIAETDPYLAVDILQTGLTEENMEAFFDGLDLVIEECDSLDMKVRIRQEARTRGIPVLMETSDRGLFDVERFDLEPDRPPFHGLLGDIDPHALHGLSTRDKAPFVMRILEAPQLSARLAASMVEIDRTVSTWPQLGGDVQLGAATVAAAVRRFGRGEGLPSGRVRVDLDTHLDVLHPPVVDQGRAGTATRTDLTAHVPAEPTEAMIHAVRLAPSGGNVQPWSISVTPTGIDINLAPDRTSAMDVAYRGSYVAIGAAALNARIAAARHSAVGSVECFPLGGAVVSLSVGEGTDADLAGQYPAMIRRISNRNFGHRQPLAGALSDDLRAAAEAEGAQLLLVTDPHRLAGLGDVLAEADRVRYLTPLLHQQMMSEIKWPGRDQMNLGIDVRTLGLDATDLAKLEVASRSDVMVHLAAWRVGAALGDATRDRVSSSSALAIVTVPGDSPGHYVQGGMAVQRVWIEANRHHLGVQPVSPAFLYARSAQDLSELSPLLQQDLAELQREFNQLLGLDPCDAPILVLRLSHGAADPVRSERLPRAQVVAVDRRPARKSA